MKVWVLMIRKFYSTEWALSAGYVYGSAYPPHFGNARSEVLKQIIASKIICKINDDALCLSCFK